MKMTINKNSLKILADVERSLVSGGAATDI
jgi:hypothetical protein